LNIFYWQQFTYHLDLHIIEVRVVIYITVTLYDHKFSLQLRFGHPHPSNVHNSEVNVRIST